VTVFLSSHLLAEVDRLATRIGIIHRGRLVQELDAGEMERRRARRLVVDARDREAARRVLSAAGFAVHAAPGDAGLELRDARALDAPDEVARTLVAAGAAPLRLAVEQQDLEAHFLELVGGGQ
jgi:ABC-2 type transport system ATP-binding protein